MVRNFKLHIVFLAVMMFFMQSITAQNISLEIRLDTQDILIGDQVSLHIEVQMTDQYDITFPVFRDTLTSGVEILKVTSIDTTKIDEGKSSLVQQMLITSFDSGYYRIPPLPFVWKGQERKDTLYSSPVGLAVHTVAVDTTQEIKAIKSPMEAPVTFAEIWPLLLIFILVALIGFFVFWYIKRRKENKPVFRIEKPKEPAHRIALRELDKLSEEKLWQKNEVKLFYTRLTNIIRKYIEDRFNVHAMEQTSGEIMHEIKKGYIDDKHLQNLLSELLSLADMVKFARNIPLPDENERLMKHAYDFVISTRQQITEEHTENNENEGGDKA